VEVMLPGVLKQAAAVAGLPLHTIVDYDARTLNVRLIADDEHNHTSYLARSSRFSLSVKAMMQEFMSLCGSSPCLQQESLRWMSCSVSLATEVRRRRRRSSSALHGGRYIDKEDIQLKKRLSLQSH
jgi:hypothetical protein